MIFMDNPRNNTQATVTSFLIWPYLMTLDSWFLLLGITNWDSGTWLVRTNQRDSLDTIRRYSLSHSLLIIDKLYLPVLREKLSCSTPLVSASIPVRKVTIQIGLVKSDSVLLTKERELVFNPTSLVLVGTVGSKFGTSVLLLDTPWRLTSQTLMLLLFLPMVNILLLEEKTRSLSIGISLIWRNLNMNMKQVPQSTKLLSILYFTGLLLLLKTKSESGRLMDKRNSYVI